MSRVCTAGRPPSRTVVAASAARTRRPANPAPASPAPARAPARTRRSEQHQRDDPQTARQTRMNTTSTHDGNLFCRAETRLGPRGRQERVRQPVATRDDPPAAGRDHGVDARTLSLAETFPNRRCGRPPPTTNTGTDTTTATVAIAATTAASGHGRRNRMRMTGPSIGREIRRTTSRSIQGPGSWRMPSTCVPADGQRLDAVLLTVGAHEWGPCDGWSPRPVPGRAARMGCVPGHISAERCHTSGRPTTSVRDPASTTRGGHRAG